MDALLRLMWHTRSEQTGARYYLNKEDVIGSSGVVNQQLVVTWKHDAHHLLKRYTLDGQYLGDISLPVPARYLQ